MIRALGTLGRDQTVQAQALEAYTALQQQTRPIDPNVIPALVSILAFTGDAARYEEFLTRFHKASTPQEERRYLFSLAAFRIPELLERTLGENPDRRDPHSRCALPRQQPLTQCVHS
jgi:puromycin-sensitive aminopeptidase